MDNNVHSASPTDFGEDSLYSCLQRASKELQVLNIMSSEVVTVSPADSIQHAARVMSQNHLWCLPVVENDIFRGTLTQEVVLREIARPTEAPHVTRVAERMQPRAHGIAPHASICDASWLMEQAKVKWLPVVAEDRLVGVVTQSDVTRALISPLRSIAVATIMKPEVVAVNASTSLSEAARVMVNENISCVIVMQDHKPAGILTPADMIETAVANERDSREILVVDAMSSPIVSVPPSECLVTANRVMDRKRLRRLVVMDGEQVCGIITQTDVLQALQEALLRDELESPEAFDDL